MWWREWCVVTLFGVKRSRDKIRKLLPRYDTILQNWRKRKQCNYLCQPKFIRNWVLRISVQNINYSHPLLFEITRTFVGNWIIFFDIWSTEEKLSNPLFPLNNSDKGSKISKGVFMGVKSLKRVCKLGIFSVILTFVKATIDGNKLLIFAYWPCFEN